LIESLIEENGVTMQSLVVVVLVSTAD